MEDGPRGDAREDPFAVEQKPKAGDRFLVRDEDLAIEPEPLEED